MAARAKAKTFWPNPLLLTYIHLHCFLLQPVLSHFHEFCCKLKKKYRTSEEKTGTSSYFCKNVYNRYVKQQTSLVSAYAIMG